MGPSEPTHESGIGQTALRAEGSLLFGYRMLYKLEDKLPFSRHRCSLRTNPSRHSSSSARLTVARERCSSAAMVLIASQQRLSASAWSCRQRWTTTARCPNPELWIELKQLINHHPAFPGRPVCAAAADVLPAAAALVVHS